MPDSLTGLTALVTLSLEKCGLSNIPTAIAALALSLATLQLPFNEDLQLADDDIAVLLALPRLRTLDLQKQSLMCPIDNATAVALSARLNYVPAP